MSETNATGDAIAEMEAEVSRIMAEQRCERHMAFRQVVKRNPELCQRYDRAYNERHRARQAARRGGW